MLTAQDLNILQKVSPFRNQRLFCEFLPTGYDLTTLSSVPNKNQVVDLKIILGTLITLYDDFADRPDRLNPRLLDILYRIPFEQIEGHDIFLSHQEKFSVNLAKSLFKKLLSALELLPNYHQLFSIFCFDLKQFFLANHYCELLTEHHYLSNSSENRLYLHQNMGIVMAGMIDLMSLPNFNFSELGQVRSLFLLGQRAGRISNVITTFDREKGEDDFTSEVLAHFAPNFEFLENELSLLFQEMDHYKNIQSFSALKYRQGIQALHELHLKLKGVI